MRQCVERMPRRRLPRAGPQGHAAAAGAHRRVDGSAHPPLQALHRGLPRAGGRDLRRGRVAARRDRVLSRVRRHREAGPAAHPRPVVLQPAVDGRDGAGRRCSPTRSRSSRASIRSWGRSTASGRSRLRTSTRRARSSPAYPHKKSAVLPLLHLAQDQDGWVTPDAIEEIADLLDLTPALVLGTCSFYTMFKREPVGKLLVSVCTNVSCLVNGGPELLDHLRAALRGRPRRHGRRGRVHRRVRPRAGAPGELRVPRPAHRPDAAVDWSTSTSAGKRVARTISGTPGARAS